LYAISPVHPPEYYRDAKLSSLGPGDRKHQPFLRAESSKWMGLCRDEFTGSHTQSSTNNTHADKSHVITSTTFLILYLVLLTPI